MELSQDCQKNVKWGADTLPGGVMLQHCPANQIPKYYFLASMAS